MIWETIVIWIVRYWIGGILTLGFLDIMNWVYAKNKPKDERYENSHRLMIFVLWPLMLLVSLSSIIKKLLK